MANREYSVTCELTVNIPISEGTLNSAAFQKRRNTMAKVARILESEGIVFEVRYQKSHMKILGE